MKNITIYICFSLFFASRVWACDCNDIIGEDKSNLVFNGTVLKISRLGKSSELEILFKVDKVIKGKKVKKRIKIYTPCSQDICCGFSFIVKAKYYVVTREINKTIYSDACTTTTKL
jgi:ribosomal protein L19